MVQLAPIQPARVDPDDLASGSTSGEPGDELVHLNHTIFVGIGRFEKGLDLLLVDAKLFKDLKLLSQHVQLGRAIEASDRILKRFYRFLGGRFSNPHSKAQHSSPLDSLEWG